MSELTRETVEEWLRLAEAATPGPWEYRDDKEWGYMIFGTRDDGDPVLGCTYYDGPQLVCHAEDEPLVLAARTAVPALCRALLKAWDDVPNDWRTEAMAARAVISELAQGYEYDPCGPTMLTYAAVRAANGG